MRGQIYVLVKSVPVLIVYVIYSKFADKISMDFDIPIFS